MKSIMLWAICMLTCEILNAQITSGEPVEEFAVTYTPTINSAEHLHLKMGFGSAGISNAHEIKKVKDGTVTCIDIVYSDYPKGLKFEVLTKNRINQVLRLMPELKNDTSVTWRFVRQTNCPDEKTARNLFHGIVVTYRPKPTPEVMRDEIAKIKKNLTPATNNQDVAESSVTVITESSYKDARGKDVITSRDTLLFAVSGDSLKGGVVCSPFISYWHPDNVVTEVLKRNTWTDMLIVADVTGSMYPYTTQLLAWIQLNAKSNKVKEYVFFNDGDMTPDNQKKVGKIGGVYSTKSNVYKDIEGKAFETMRKGGGGDAPENNIEATLKGMELCTDCKDIIWIADNWANIKDIALMEKLNKPIKIILCGTDFGINTQYLDLARKTGGSVHTMNKDITHLMKMNEGETIEIGGQTFMIKKGVFVKVSKA